MSLGESRGVGMEGWLTVDFFVAAGGEGGSEGREKEKRTKVEGEREEKGEKKLQAEQGMGHGEEQVRGGWMMFVGTQHPRSTATLGPGTRQGKLWLCLALSLTSIVKTQCFMICKHRARQGCGHPPLLTSFLRGLATPRQGALGRGAAVLGFPGGFPVRHPAGAPRRAGLACVCGHPHLAGVSPVHPTHPPPFSTTLCPQLGQPSLRALPRLRGQGQLPHDCPQPELRVVCVHMHMSVGW